MENLKEHFIKTLIVVCASISMMFFVTKIVVPIQSNFLPEITLYAAFISSARYQSFISLVVWLGFSILSVYLEHIYFYYIR